MTSRLRPIGILTMSLLCLGAWSPAYSSEPLQTATATTPLAARASEDSTIIIPGPLRSLLRMAAVSQQVSPEDVLPLVAHNIAIRGYFERTKPTEFWFLLSRYIQQARELQAMAGPTETIRVAKCSEAGPLFHTLGYRLKLDCTPKNIALVTDAPERAFLTLDSGFPLTDLEEALQKGVPFVYVYHSSRIPVMFRESDWTGLGVVRRFSDNQDLLSVLLHDPEVPRLYSALSRVDTATRYQLKSGLGLKRLLPYAAVLDFYGGQIAIRSGRVVVPGGDAAEAGWKTIVGESPEDPANFIMHLLSRDDGWTATYFDALSRLGQSQQAHFTQMPRMKNLYDAFRATGTQLSATGGVFPKAPELLVLLTQTEWESDGAPHVPGNLDVWKDILRLKTDSKVQQAWGRRAAGWQRPEQLLEGVTALSRLDSDSGALPTYLMLSEIDRRRDPQERLSPATVRLMGQRFTEFSNWFLIFSEFPDLNDANISSFINVADNIDKIQNRALRANVLGAFQANIGLWQILARQGQIPKAQQSRSWQSVIGPFAKIFSNIQLFDAARSSLSGMMLAATGKPTYSQDEIIDLLAGPAQDTPDAQRAHAELAKKMRSVLEDQRLVSLDTLSALSDGLNSMSQGSPADDDLLSLAGELREFEMPRPILTENEKVGWAPAVYSSRHVELQVQTDLTKVIKARGPKTQLVAARGQLAPFLRDTLVGLNYAYYEPPGAQLLHNNPLFIRAHDFSGLTITGPEKHWSVPDLVGAGTPAGGGAYLMGSLSDLPYALARAEQNFLVSQNLQALIWEELVPKLLVDATLPRWWNVSSNELHAAALYQQFGEDLLRASAQDAPLRNKVTDILTDRMGPKRLEWATQPLISADQMKAILLQTTPADTFYLATEFRRKFPAEAVSWGPAGQQLDALSHHDASEVNPERLATDFGVPHPTFSRTNARELLNIKPLYFSGGNAARLFGESWESTNLYWARLADEMGYSPAALNSLVPQLTRNMITNIFATDLDDWPALLRAMDETGQAFRQGKIAGLPPANTISQTSAQTSSGH